MQPTSLVTRTELAVAALSGTIVDGGDHLVVSTPTQPSFYWGNFVVVPAPRDADEVAQWIARAGEVAAPGVAHVAVVIDGPLAALSTEVIAAFEAAGLAREELIAMTSTTEVNAPSTRFDVRPFDGDDDWAALRALSLVTDEQPGMAAYLDGWIPSRRACIAAGQARWWGAFDGARLVASAGVVPLGAVARYQDVQTHPDLRRQGAASAVLAAIAADERARGASSLVIVVGADNEPARGAYRRLGFVDGDRAVQALRRPG